MIQTSAGVPRFATVAPIRLLRDGEIDLLFTTLPIVEPDLATS
jgi:hypothetical protein